MWLRTSQSIPNDPQLRPAKEKHGAGREKSRGGEAEASQLTLHCWPATRLNLSNGVHPRPIAAQGAACNPKIAREQLAAGSQDGIPHMPSTAPWDPSTNVRRGPRVGDLGGLGTVGVGVMHQRPSRLSWATHSHQSALAVAIEIGAGRHLHYE